MAINKNKVQLQETVLDSNGHPLSSTDVNPLTSSDCVIMENGMTLEDVMGNDTVIDTPTIMNEDTSFKVGIGDSETKVIDSDVAKMVIEGKTYQNILPKPTTLIMNTDEKEFKINDKIDSSIVLDDNVAEIATVKGQTYVNVVQEESASEYVAIDEELNGQSITTTGKPESMVKNATLEGLTLINTIQEPSGADATVLDLDADINAQTATIDNTVQGGIHGAILKGQTLVNLLNPVKTQSVNNYVQNFQYGLKELTIIITNKTVDKYPRLSIYDSNTKKWLRNINPTFTGNKLHYVAKDGEYVGGMVFTTYGSNINIYDYSSLDEYLLQQIMVLEGDYTNVDIPYFEGMQSVEVPSVKTTGKNLFDGELIIGKIEDNGKPNTYVSTMCMSANYVRVQPNTTYNYKWSQERNNSRVFFYDVNKNFIKKDENIIPPTGGQFTTPSNCYYILFHLAQNTGMDSYTVLITKSNDLTYEPYKSSTLTTPSDVVLRKIGDVQDELDLETGKLTQRVGEFIVTNDYSWYSVKENENTISAQTSLPAELKGLFVKNTPNKPLMCDKIKYLGNSSDEEHIRFSTPSDTLYSNNLNIWLNKNKLTSYDSAGIKQYIQSIGGITVQGALVTEVIKTVDLSIVDQDNNAVKSIQTHPTLTHVSTSSQGLIPFVTIPSQLKYPTIIKPSTTYTVQLKQTTVNSEFPLTINLGGTTMAVPSTKFTITTPSELTSQDVIFTGKNNVIGEVVITEGDTTGIEYRYFEGMNDVTFGKVLANGKNLLNSNKRVIEETNTYGYIDLTDYDGVLRFSITDKDETIDISEIYLGATYQGHNYDGTDGTSGGWLVGGGKIQTRSLATSVCKYFSFFPNKQETLDKIMQRFNIQVEKGTTATSYEPYKGVTIEQDIDSIPLTSDMFEQGGIDAGNATVINGMSYQQFPQEGTSTNKIKSKTIIPVKPNAKYKINFRGYAIMFDKNGGYVKIGSQPTLNFTSGVEFTIPSNVHYMVLCMKISDNSTITPSTLDSLNLTLQEVTDEIVLRSIGDVKDTLNLTTGEYVQRIGEVVFDETVEDTIRIHQPNNSELLTFRLESIANDGIINVQSMSDKLLWDNTSGMINYPYSFRLAPYGNPAIIQLFVCLPKSALSEETAKGLKGWLTNNPIKIQYQLATPIIHKVNLTNTTKLPSYTSITHYDTIVPSDSLIPNIKIPSTIDYNVAIKPSTQYTIRANTTSAMSVNLGGSTGTLANGKVTLTTPFTLAHNSLKLGNGKVKELMVVEGNEIKDNVPFFNGMKNVQMGGIKLVNIARGAVANSLVSSNANGTQYTYTSDGTNWGKITFDKSLLKPNTKYTIKMNVISNCSSIKVQLGHAGWNYYNINNNVTGIISGTIITPPTVKCELPSSDANYFDDSFCIYFRNADSGQQTVIQNPMIIEGDWTHLDEIPYIESEMIIEQPIIRSQGKNLFDMNTLKVKANYNNQIKSLDGQKVVFTTAGEWSGVSSGWMKLKPNTTYTFGGEKSRNEIKLFYRLRLNNGDTDSAKIAKTFTTQNSGEVIFNFETSVSDNVDNTVSNVYLYEGNITSPSYEPFKQHTLSSNRVIGYEEGVHYGGITGIKSFNADFNSVMADVEGLSIAYVTNGSSNFSFWDKDMVFISGKSYLDTSLSSDNKNGFIQVPSNAKYMKFASSIFASNATYYAKATVTGELPLRSLPNGVCDSFNLVTGEYIQRIGEAVLDGDEEWTQNGNGSYGFFTTRQDSKPSSTIVCDKLKEITGWNNYSEKGIFRGAQAFGIVVTSNELTTCNVEAFKTWLSQNPITVQYELETPIVRKIGLTAKGVFAEASLGDCEWGASPTTANNTFTTRYRTKSASSLPIVYNTHLFTDDFDVRHFNIEAHGDYEYVSNMEYGQYVNVRRERLESDTVESFKKWLAQNPIKVGYITWKQTSSSYSNIQKPIFFNNVKVQFMNDNVDIQPTLTLQARTRNSYVLDMAKSNTLYTVKAYSNPHDFYIDGKSFGKGTNGCITTPTLTNKLLITGQDVQELMIIEGDVTGKQLPYYKGIRSSFDNTDKVEVFVRNKNLVKELYPTLNNNTCVIENGVITIKGDGDGSGELNCVFNPSIYLEKDKTYTFSFSSDAQFGKTNGTDTVEAFLLKDGGTGYYIETYGFTKVFTCGATGYYNIRLDINKNNTTHKFYNIQIEESPTATPYQPHEENTTIINMPTQLETVEVVKPVIEVGSVNADNGNNSDDTTKRRSKDYIPVKPGMILTFMNGNTYRAENIYLYGIDKNYLGAKYTNGSGDLTIPKDCYFIRFYSGASNINDMSVIKKQYKPIALNELPNGVKDELIINRATSSAKLIRRVGKIVLDGSENWTLNVNNAIKFNSYCNGFNGKSQTTVISDKLISVMDDEVSKITTSTVGGFAINLLKSEYTSVVDLSTFKKYLKQNPITVYYELAEPVITEIRLKGYPFIYEDGSITLNTDIAPVTRTSYNVNQHQLINSQNETIIRHDKQISDLYDYIEIYLDEIYRMELFKMQLELSL